jgi:hypothetical protein
MFFPIFHPPPNYAILYALRSQFFMSSRIVLTLAGVLIALGGFYDTLTPRLPPYLAAICADNLPARKLIRELLRGLGGCLVAIGATVALLANSAQAHRNYVLCLILILVLPSEGANSVGMYRVRSPWLFAPLSFMALTLLGVALASAER